MNKHGVKNDIGNNYIGVKDSILIEFLESLYLETFVATNEFNNLILKRIKFFLSVVSVGELFVFFSE